MFNQDLKTFNREPYFIKPSNIYSINQFRLLLKELGLSFDEGCQRYGIDPISLGEKISATRKWQQRKHRDRQRTAGL